MSEVEVNRPEAPLVIPLDYLSKKDADPVGSKPASLAPS